MAWAVVAAGLSACSLSEEPSVGATLGTVVPRLTQHGAPVRARGAYAGLGAWVDGFDFGPAYQAAGREPPVGPGAIDDMADHGVRTLFLQAVRNDPRSPGGIVDRPRVAEFLLRAHLRGVRVVGWYLPHFADLAVDLHNLELLSSFEVLGNRFDGVAVDIEATEAEPDLATRNARLVDLSSRLRAAAGRDTLGAIVLPPVLTEVVNRRYWPDFPWSEIGPLYDVWLPMSYWTFRLAASGYKDGYSYNEESTRRLRADLGQPDAVVHGIGGIGDETSPEQLTRFVQSLIDTGSVGGSVYDWNSMSTDTRVALTAAFTNAGARLPRPP
jgi:hypothetical protein